MTKQPRQDPHNCMIRTRPVRYISEQALQEAGYELPQCTDEVTIEDVDYELVSKDSEAGAWTAEELPRQEDLSCEEN